MNKDVVKCLEPKEVFSFFAEICDIPHGSFNTGKIADYLENFAKKRGLFCLRDDYDNVIIKKAASSGFKGQNTVIIQSHIDMVCTKTEDSKIDFSSDGLTLKCDGEYLSASGTSLGADNGIGVAVALAVLDSDSIIHPNLECVFTSNEEVGMVGASALDMSTLCGKYMLNIDSENEGEFTVGCAGGVTLVASMPKVKIEKHFESYIEIKIGGLIGGHSGSEIDKGRANANILMGRLLKELSDTLNIGICYICGGQKENAIADECTAVIGIDDYETAVLCIEKSEKEFKNEYKAVENGLFVSVLPSEPKAVFNGNVIELLSGTPNGIRAMSREIKGLVQTSSNLGIIKTLADFYELTFQIRSSVENEKNELVCEIENAVKSLGGTVTLRGNYPAWEYKKDSALREICTEIYKEQYGESPVVTVIHAGLECGIFSGKIENLDCISYGPNLIDIHSYKEKVEIKSAARVFEFTKAVLEKL